MRRPTARQRGYSPRWEKARREFLAAHPWCAYCARRGRQVRATVVDHIRPHRNDHKLFWDRKNWQGLCTPCHSSTKQREEKTGRVLGCDEHGMPLDPNHHWQERRPDGAAGTEAKTG